MPSTNGREHALGSSDLLELRVSHFLDKNLRIKRRFWIKEQKRGKRNEVVINNSIKQALSEYLKANPGVNDPHSAPLVADFQNIE